MAFSDSEIAEYSDTLERCFWSHHRPPLHLRDKIREGHRLSNQSIELFFVRPAFRRPGEEIEEPIAKLSFVRSRNQWQIYWRRANGKWEGKWGQAFNIDIPSNIAMSLWIRWNGENGGKLGSAI